MAIIDRVYRTVQHILNKEQRGYLTPQEFNNLAHLSQTEIFEMYFHDYNNFETIRRTGKAGRGFFKVSGTEYADLPKHFRERINIFSATAAIGDDPITDISFNAGVFVLPTNMYRLTTAIHNGNNIEEEEFDAVQYSQASPLGMASTNRPIYTRLGNDLKVLPSTIVSGVTVNYIRKPAIPNWSYITVNGTTLFSSGRDDYQDFEIHTADEPELVLRIVKYAGVIIKELEVSAAIAEAEAADTTLENR